MKANRKEKDESYTVNFYSFFTWFCIAIYKERIGFVR